MCYVKKINILVLIKMAEKEQIAVNYAAFMISGSGADITKTIMRINGSIQKHQQSIPSLPFLLIPFAFLYRFYYNLQLMLNNETTINKTQSSFIKSSQFLHSNLFPHRFKDQYPRMISNFTLTNKKISRSCHNQMLSKKSLHHFSESRTVNIQFNSAAKKIIPEDIIMRRKMMSSSEKFYSKKKTIIFNFIREKNQKDQDMIGSGKNFLKIGTHHISKINLESNLQQGSKTGGTSQPKNRLSIFKKKYKKQKRFTSKHESFTESNSVLVLEKKQLTRTQDFFTTLPPTFRRMTENCNIEALLKQKTEPLLEDKSIKSTEFQQFIPIRKRKIKKQPFIFGMSDKVFFNNPQKNTQKLLIYQDFLWKLNYSNGLFVKIPQKDPSYKAYIGPGNNCNLIKTILKRRFWWTITQKMQNCQFVWTQLKTNSLYKQHQQISSQMDITKLYTYHLHEGCLSQDADHHGKIFNSVDLLNWKEHKTKNNKFQETINEKTYKHRINFYKCKSISLIENSNDLLLHNHLQSNYYIGNKKALFYFMKNYYELKKQNVFNALPLTFHIVRGISDPNYKFFLKVYQQLQQRKRKGEEIKNIWIIKPGQNSNRGNGISVCFGLDDIKHRINGRQRNNDGSLRTFILQKYIERPLLYKGRKFDIRHYMLITCFNGIFKAYWYPEGYIRTSSSKFSLKKNSDLFIHLTNDAVQKYSEQYGKYEKGNKISYQAFQEYLNKPRIGIQSHEDNIFFQQILPKMKKLALDAIKSTYLYLDKQRKEHNFQLLGMDFMIDSQMKPYLIQINTNPCLQLSCPLLARIIPNLIQQTFKLCVDPLFPPPQEWQNGKKMYFSESPIEDITYQLFFDEAIDGNDVKLLLQNKGEIDRNMGKVDEDAQTFENDGNIEEDV